MYKNLVFLGLSKWGPSTSLRLKQALIKEPLVLCQCRIWQWLQKFTASQNIRWWYACNEVRVESWLALSELFGCLHRSAFKGWGRWTWYYLLFKGNCSCSLQTELYPLMNQWRWPSNSSPNFICFQSRRSRDCLKEPKEKCYMKLKNKLKWKRLLKSLIYKSGSEL